MKKILFSLSILSLLVGCTKDNQGDSPEQREEVSHLVKEFEYPSGTTENYLAHSADPLNLTWENGKIVKVQTSLVSVDVTHINDNQIKTFLVFKLTNAEKKVEAVHFFSNGKVDYVLKTDYFRYGNDPYDIRKDSIVYQYQNDRLVNVSNYQKGVIRTTNEPTYQKIQEAIITWENENIGKVVNKEYYQGQTLFVQERIYQYDDKPYISLGEMAYETPYIKVLSVDSAFYQILYHGKLGKWNKNNVILMNNLIRPDFTVEFKTIQYEREIDNHHRLVKINIKGENMAGSNYPEVDGTKFNAPIILKY